MTIVNVDRDSQLISILGEKDDIFERIDTRAAPSWDDLLKILSKIQGVVVREEKHG
jgi:hypothetical protein